MDSVNSESESHNPKKYFNPKDYSTLIVDSTGFKTPQHELAEHFETLLHLPINSDEYRELLQQLKQHYAIVDIINLISNSPSDAFTAQILRTLWECDYNSSEHAAALLPYVFSPVFTIALEALTVFQECMPKLQAEQLASISEYLNTHQQTGIESIKTEFIAWLNSYT